MSSLADLPELVGFFSYSREDDAGAFGALSALRERIQHELRAQLGRTARTFRIWQDKEAIPSGTLWESEIKNSVEQAVFFIPIITPTVVASPYCRFELDSFLAREAALGRSDLVFPLLYIHVPALEDGVRRQNDAVLSLIAKRQYVDWRELRHLDSNATEVKRAIERFCGHIRDALNKPLLSPEERKQQEDAVALARAEAERRRQEAELKRGIEEEARQGTAEEVRHPGEVEAERKRGEAARRRAVPAATKPDPQRRRGLLAGAIALSLLVSGAAAYLLYSIQSEPLVRTLTGHSADADSVAFSPDGKMLAAGGWDESIVLWNAADGKPALTIKNFAGHTAPFSPDGKWIAGGSDDSTLTIWSATTGRAVHTFSKHTKKVQTVAFSPDGTQLVSGGEDAMVYLWNIANEQPVRAFVGHGDKVFATAFSPDGKRIVSAGFDGKIMVWDAATGQNIYPPLSSNQAKVVSAVFAPDGGSIASGGYDFNIHVWDADTGQHLRAYPGNSIVDSVSYSPDGKLIVAGYNDGSLNVWDAQTVKLVRTFTGHSGTVWAVGFSPDGKTIASASADRTVKIWKSP